MRHLLADLGNVAAGFTVTALYLIGRHEYRNQIRDEQGKADREFARRNRVLR